MIALATVTDMPYADEFLYGRGSECIVPLAFLIVSALTWGFYLGAITLEPAMLPCLGAALPNPESPLDVPASTPLGARMPCRSTRQRASDRRETSVS